MKDGSDEFQELSQFLETSFGTTKAFSLRCKGGGNCQLVLNRRWVVVEESQLHSLGGAQNNTASKISVTGPPSEIRSFVNALLTVATVKSPNMMQAPKTKPPYRHTPVRIHSPAPVQT